ncbi:MAG: 50S ribosomal protein L9 [Candidatus Nanopelagicaceae bacterium]|jgi:large subunit ribosomal protein L9
MKLILTREVKGLGHAGDIVTVKDGYGRNFLIPEGSAIAWSKGGESQIEGLRRARSAREIRDNEHANQIKSSLESGEITLKARAGNEGQLFGSVTTKEIALAIKAKTGLDVDRHKISTKGQIKKIGKHSAKVALHANIVADLTIVVVAE